MRRLVIFIALNALAVAIYAVVAIEMGFFSHVSETLFWSPDSQSYRDVADWLFGGPNTVQSTHRTFLYPLLLGGSQRIGGVAGIWALNAVCWLGMLNITAAATWRIIGRAALAAIVFIVLASNVSIIVLSFQALTELVTLLFESLWILGIAWSSMPPARPRDFAMLLLPITLLTVVKPGYQLELLVALVLLGITIWRLRRGRFAAIAAVAACCIPLAFQLGVNAIGNHFIGLSSTGEIELRDYYVAQVYAELNGLPDDLIAARPVVDSWSHGQLASFILQHPGAAAGTLLSNLHGNLTSPSSFIDPAKNPSLWSLTRNTNRGYQRLHLIFIPVVALAIWRRRDVRLVLLYTLGAILILMPSLIYDQGDRYVDMALPFWAVAYTLAVWELVPDATQVLTRLRRQSYA